MGWTGPGIYDGDPVWDAFEAYAKVLGIKQTWDLPREETFGELDKYEVANALRAKGRECLKLMLNDITNPQYDSRRKRYSPQHGAYVYVLADFYFYAGVTPPPHLNAFRRIHVKCELENIELHGWDPEYEQERRELLVKWNSKFS